MGIKDYFNTILVSEAEQTRKPQTKIFHTALSRLKVKPENSVYIGDNLQTDIVGAKNAGLKAIWKRDRSTEQPETADAIVDELNEILPILKQW